MSTIESTVVELLRTHGVKAVAKRLGIGHARVRRIRRRHGIRPHKSLDPTPAGIRQQIEELIETTNMNVSEIARCCGVSNHTVAKIRDRMELDDPDPTPEEIAEIERRKKEVRLRKELVRCG